MISFVDVKLAEDDHEMKTILPDRYNSLIQDFKQNDPYLPQQNHVLNMDRAKTQIHINQDLPLSREGCETANIDEMTPAVSLTYLQGYPLDKTAVNQRYLSHN